MFRGDGAPHKNVPGGWVMVALSELSLEHLPIESPDLAVTPLPYFAAARKRHPWLATSHVGYVVTEYQAIKDILGQDDKLRFPADQVVEVMGAQDTGWGKFTLEMMISRHGIDHDRLRGSVASAFTPRSVNRFRPLMQKTVAKLLDEWAPKAEFDFAVFAAQFPVQIMFALIGADPVAVPDVANSLEIHASSYGFDASRMPIIEAAYQQLWGFVDDLIVRRTAEGRRDDLLDTLMQANASGALSDVELRQMLIFLFGAGYDTSKNQLTLTMRAMIDRPDLWKRCAEDRPFCDKVVEEGLRFWSPSSTYRLVVEELVHRDVVFPEGTMLMFPLAVAGRDADTFADPDLFNPDRRQADRQIPFGRGLHMCLGQFLARANQEEALHLIAQRITNPRLAGEVTWRPFPGTWGIRSLPIVFGPRAGARARRRTGGLAAPGRLRRYCRTTMGGPDRG
jgi:cytochrome P450